MPGTHGCFVEVADGDDCMDAEDDYSHTGSNENLKHDLCNEKVEDNCKEPLEEPKADDDVFQSVVGDEKCQLEGTLKLFEYPVAFTWIIPMAQHHLFLNAMKDLYPTGS